jgi:hypothetical protein
VDAYVSENIPRVGEIQTGEKWWRILKILYYTGIGSSG